MVILVAVALDPLRRQVLDIAAELGRALDEELYLVYIVMGHTSKKPIGTLTEGNAAFAVVDSAPIPVTIVPVRVARTATSNREGV